jgi:peptidoglycan LD-endopeptidase LytH
MRQSARASARIGLWILASFLAGALVGMLLMAGFRGGTLFDRASQDATLLDKARSVDSARTIDRATTVDSAKPIESAKPADSAKIADVQSPQSAVPTASLSPPPDMDDAIDDLRDRDLLVPVRGVTREMLRDSFKEARDKIREHEAVDILAPRRTPVVAVEDGTIAKFFTSERGGITIYQFDPKQTYAYYYAHLDSYASGLSEGDRVTRGQTIGYVGTTGNAPENTPHLHFQIFVLTDQKQWWKGTAVNPYDVWKK